MCNIINHGYDRARTGASGSAALGAENRGSARACGSWSRIARGRWTSRSIRSRDLDDIRPGGLGVFIIHEVMDDVNYENRDDGGMRLTMVKQVPEAATTPDESAGCRLRDRR